MFDQRAANAIERRARSARTFVQSSGTVVQFFFVSGIEDAKERFKSLFSASGKPLHRKCIGPIFAASMTGFKAARMKEHYRSLNNYRFPRKRCEFRAEGEPSAITTVDRLARSID
ncbi:hypothetical protein [Paraburkholderia sp. J69-1]|uniref:hypothetical protein n=1 Tax=Paraburkholderia sp. J69-1 TaxID=2805436 RepID=UPI002AB72217|nr:hypothetical protein [Paraburkholderia sp. J69-1]